jgi:hypothetical protein
MSMSAKAEVLREEFEFTFSALDRTLEGTDEKEYIYRLTPASNNIQAILYHLSRITNHNLPSIIRGEPYHTPGDKPAELDEPSKTLEKLLDDIDEGKGIVIEGVAGLSEEDLEKTVPLMAGPYPRKIGLYAYLGELFHHRGQIAFIRGTIKRLRERDSGFLR